MQDDSLPVTEARIIREDETHAVIALSVAKASLRAFLQRNNVFIAALGDLPPPLVPPQPD
jgi:hypothetical protein